MSDRCAPLFASGLTMPELMAPALDGTGVSCVLLDLRTTSSFHRALAMSCRHQELPLKEALEALQQANLACLLALRLPLA